MKKGLVLLLVVTTLVVLFVLNVYALTCQWDPGPFDGTYTTNLIDVYGATPGAGCVARCTGGSDGQGCFASNTPCLSTMRCYTRGGSATGCTIDSVTCTRKPCIDSDPSQDIYVYGYVNYYDTNSRSRQTIYDGCISGSVRQYYCISPDLIGYTTTSCSPGSCSNGVCVCVNECSTSGLRRCYSSTAYQTCGNCDADSCLDWCSLTYCASGQVCSNGVCCTPMTCSALGKNCGSWSDGCGGTLNCGTCASGETCSNGVCVCSNECSTSGVKECVTGTSYRTCGNYDADPCLEWSSVTSCPSCQTCSGGNCVNSCQGTSASCGCSSCTNCDTSGTGGGRAGDGCIGTTYVDYSCTGTSCTYTTTVNDPRCCTDDCTPIGSRKCFGNFNYQTCGNYDADSCLEWSSSTACSSGQFCYQGSCTACTSETNYHPDHLCLDGIDNDCDGLTDCKDPDCSYLGACSCTSPVAEVCNNGKDDDCDGVIDCADTDCASASICTAPCLAGSCSIAMCKPRTEICGNGIDDDCDGDSDYDTFDGRHGDAECPVGVSSLSVSSSSPTVGSSITVNCTSSVANVNSIVASVDGVGLCTWQSWVGSVAVFSCNVGSTVGSRTVRCSVDATKSYQSGSDSTTTINVLASTCSAYVTSSSCVADSRCAWCAQCVGVKYSGGVDRCVNAGTCPVPYCWRGVCGAGCDDTQGGCISPSACDVVTSCTCSCVSCSANSCFNSTAVRSCAAGCLGSVINCVAGQYCSNGACTSCSAEVCGSGLDEDCDGLIDCEDTDCSGSVLCCVGDDCGCPTGTRLCNDGVCRAACAVNTPCDNDGVCESGEGCSCADCFNKRDSCKPGNVCDADTKVCGCEVGLMPCLGGSCNAGCGSCSNGIIEHGESCDPNAALYTSCSGLGFDGGSLSCSDDCNFDTSACTGSSGVCGDGVRNVGEDCDGLDFGSDVDCSVLSFSGGVLDCNSDCKYDTNACYDVPACDSNGDCPPGAVCGIDGRCGCPDGTDLCSDGTCSDDCDSTDGGFRGCIVENGVCEFGESCYCADCDGLRGSCDFASSCVDGFCSECGLSDAFWDVDNCKGNVCVVANDSLVDLIASGTVGCGGRSFKFRVFWKGDDNNVVGYPSSAVFEGGRVASDWIVFWKDASGFLGLGSDDPMYEFFVRAVGIGAVYSNNKLLVCDNDDDCDGVRNGEDECSNTPYGEAVRKEGAYRGCSDSQIDCISQIDCSMVPWSECDASNQRTRKICKNPVTGEAFFDAAGDCCDQQSTCMCSLGTCSNRGNWIPTVRECLVEEDFPFFNAVNVLIVVSLLLVFYLFRFRKS